MTEEENALLNEKRERVRKKDQEDVGAAAAKGKDKKPPAKGKGAAKDEKADEPEDKPIEFPKPENHMNAQIKEFLEHFQSARRIVIEEVQSTPR